MKQLNPIQRVILWLYIRLFHISNRRFELILLFGVALILLLLMLDFYERYALVMGGIRY